MPYFFCKDNYFWANIRIFIKIIRDTVNESVDKTKKNDMFPVCSGSSELVIESGHLKFGTPVQLISYFLLLRRKGIDKGFI